MTRAEEAANKFAVLYDQGTCDGIAQDCFKAGAEWQKEQMMKDAVDTYVDDLNGDIYNRCIEMGFTGEDEVKLIIVKEDNR